jgi:hypothetical protein
MGKQITWTFAPSDFLRTSLYDCGLPKLLMYGSNFALAIDYVFSLCDCLYFHGWDYINPILKYQI